MNALGVRPSFATGFAHSADESEYPECWKGLVGFWPIFLGQTGSRSIDFSRNGMHGMFGVEASSPSWGVGEFGSITKFDGSDYINMTNSGILDGTYSGLTVIIWIKVHEWVNFGGFIGKLTNGAIADGWSMYLGSEGTPWKMYYGGQSAAADADIVGDGKLHMCAFSWSPNTGLLYQDGVLQTNTITKTPYVNDTSSLGFGRFYPDSAAYQLNGDISHAMIYNRPMPLNEIAFLHQNPTALVQLRRRAVMVSVGVGGEEFLRTINDGIGIVDSMSRTQALSRTITDGVGTVDNMGRTQVLARTLAEAMGLTDSLWKAQTRIIADAVGITDAITKAQAFARTIADDIELVDTKGWFGVNGTAHLIDNCGSEDNRNCYEALNGTDSWQHTVPHEEHEFTLDLKAVHNITQLRGRSFAAAAMDPIDIDVYVSLTNGNWGEAVASGISTWQDRADWDGDAIINSTDKQGRFVRVIVRDTEGTYKAMIWGRSSEPFKIFDVYYDDAITRIMTYARTLAEALGIEDAQTVSRGDVRTVSDGIGITDSVTRTVAFARVVADAMGIEDVVTRTQVQLRTIADAMGLTDIMAPGQLIVFAEAMGITDAMTHTKTQIRTFAEAMGIADDMTRIAVYIFTQADDVGIADAMVRVAVALRTVSDDVGMTDEMSSQIGDLVKAAWAFMLIRQTHN